MSKPRFLLLILALCVFVKSETVHAQIIEETGSLRGFLAGDCPGCAYDNFVSHVTEGIARENYNVYNPLDPQTTGFGRYDPIPDGQVGDLLLASWRAMFDEMIRGHWQSAELIRSTELERQPFAIVHLTDTTLSRSFYIVREALDSGFVDLNDPGNHDDDEIGSFAKSWGLYVFSESAMRPEVTLQVIHPNDDYISSYIAIDWFEYLDAGQIFFTSAGREVYWTGVGNYTNSRSLCDPSRNGRHVFQMAHEATFDYYVDVAQVMPHMLQLHSYDTRNRNFTSLIATPGFFDRDFNLPMYDWSGLVGGFIDRTPWQVHPAGVIGNTEPVLITEYYSTSSEPRLVVHEPGNPEEQLSDPNDLYGYSQSKQFNYRSNEFDGCTDEEWQMHFEFDELPDPIEDSTEAEFYGGAGFPLTIENFENIIAYMRPVVENLAASLDSLELYVDMDAPLPPSQLEVQRVAENRVTLDWMRAADPRFSSYRLYYDELPGVTTASPYLDRNNSGELCEQGKTSSTILNLEYDTDYYFRVSAVDLDGRESTLSNEVMARTENTPRLLAPLGGETWDWMTPTQIRWAGVGFEEGVWVELNRNHPFSDWELIAEDLEDTGEAMIVAGAPLTDRARLRIFTEDEEVEVTMPANFTITSFGPYIEVVQAGSSEGVITELEFGMIDCPLDSVVDLVIRNAGLQTLILVDPILVAGGGFDLTVPCNLIVDVPPGELAPCAVSVGFDEAGDGVYEDTLIIDSNSSNGENGQYRLPIAAERVRTIPSPRVVLSYDTRELRIAWDPVVETATGCPLICDYTVYFCPEVGSEQFLLATTSDTSIVHEGVLDNEDILFYTVRAELSEE